MKTSKKTERKPKGNPVLAGYAKKERRKSSVRQGSYGKLVTVGSNTRKARLQSKLSSLFRTAKDPETRKKLRQTIKDLKSL